MPEQRCNICSHISCVQYNNEKRFIRTVKYYNNENLFNQFLIPGDIKDCNLFPEVYDWWQNYLSIPSVVLPYFSLFSK